MSDEDRATDRDRIRSAACCLGPRERAVLMLGAAEDLGIEAIASRLGITPAEAEAALADAIFKLGRALRVPERD